MVWRGRAADVVADVHTVCFSLGRKAFTELLGPIEDVWRFEALRKVCASTKLGPHSPACFTSKVLDAMTQATPGHSRCGPAGAAGPASKPLKQRCCCPGAGAVRADGEAAVRPGALHEDARHIRGPDGLPPGGPR